MATATPASGASGGMTKWLVGAAVVIAIVGLGVWAGTQGQVVAVRQQDMKFLSENGKKPGVITTGSGLQYDIIRQGSGPAGCAASRLVGVGWLVLVLTQYGK